MARVGVIKQRPRGARSLGGRPRRQGVFRPECPKHPGSKVSLDGHFRRTSDFFVRPRFRCTPRGSRKHHAFGIPESVRHPTAMFPDAGQACPHCDQKYERHEGPRTGTDFTFALHEIRDALIAVGAGKSLRETGEDIRDDILRKCQRTWQHIGPGQLSREARLAISYVDAYAPVILKALHPTHWPRIVAIDSMPLRTRGYRDGKRVGDLEAGEILVAVDQTGREGVVCLMGVEGGKDHEAWLHFFAKLEGEPEWIIADLDSAIAKAVRIAFPNAVLYRARDHLMRLMQERLAADGVPEQVRIRKSPSQQPRKRAIWAPQKVQEFEAHPLHLAVKYCQTDLAAWEHFKELVEQHIPHSKTALRSWMATNEPLILLQMRLPNVLGIHKVGSGRVESVIRDFLGKHVKPRAGRFQNEARFNKVLGLMTLHLRKDDPRRPLPGPPASALQRHRQPLRGGGLERLQRPLRPGLHSGPGE